ncbi:hypothetical protein AB4480_24005, partial [Vibrio sp. 10N.261.45.A4]|uniref:hypothetical protein n=1 Tax=Vibrio sp. 10N.261.45.A4 TaxID=3229655 RepID=UPI00355353DA
MLGVHKRQFKSDSARLAFLVWVEFSVYGGQIECCGRVLHTLIGLHGLPLLSTIAPADNSGSDSSSTFGV